MFADVKYILGKESKMLRSPIALLVLDTIFSMCFYGALYMVLIDLINSTFTVDKIKVYTFFLVMVFITRGLFAMVAYEQIHTRGARIVENLRVRLGDHIRTLNLGYFNKNSIGSLSNILTNDLQDFEHILTHNTSDLIKTILLTVYLMIVIFTIDIQIGIYQLMILGISIPIILIGGHFLAVIGDKKKRVLNEVISRMVEYLSGIRVFKSYNMVGDSFKRLDDTFRQFKVECIKTEISIVPFIMIFQLIVDLSFPVLLWIALMKFGDGELSKQALLSYVVVNLALTNVLRAFGPQYGIFRYMKLASGKIAKTLKEIPVAFNQSKVVFDNYDIEFDDVYFSYEQETPILSGLSFKAKSGEMMALIGPSGSGKTTVTSLIARFWDVDRGAIRIGGVDIKNIEPDGLMEHISMVFQDVYLLNDTVYNNILLGKPDATREQVIKVSKIARCHDFIDKMKSGYETVIGEGGATLSGGEKQRISIARALLKDAPIILLDEATASLDADNEYEIRGAIEKLTANKTVVVIAHRLNTIQRADQIVLLKDGLVEESGAHAALLKKKGHYYNLHREIEKSMDWEIKSM